MTQRIYKIQYLFVFIVLFSIFGFSSISSAYFTTAQDAQVIENKSILFTIDYRFGMEKYAVHMPIIATNTTATSNQAISYSVLNEDNEIVTGKISGIVLSNTPIQKNGMYVIPKGIAKKMTLAVIFTPDTATEGDKFRLQVNYLPFKFDGRGQLQLNPSELQYYTTKLLSL